jgi:hypothetical protein
MSDLISWTPFYDSYNKHKYPQGVLNMQSLWATTRNFMDAGRVYAYTVENGVIYCQIDGNTKAPLPGGNPVQNGQTLTVVNLTADNNRVFVVAKDSIGNKSLWWNCVKKDQAIWSKMLIDQGGDLMKQGYKEWTKAVHQEGVWTNLLTLREFEKYLVPKAKLITYDSTFTDSLGNSHTIKIPKLSLMVDVLPRQAMDVNDVIDLAVGNWTGTVITYYVLLGSVGEIRYIDEEVVMDRWQTVPHLCEECKNSPYPLSSDCKIDASNSVLCVSKPGVSGHKLYWIRWDFHNHQDFKYWQLDWCEHDWHSIVCPQSTITGLSFDSHWPGGDIRDTMWTAPRTAWGSNWQGFLGHIPTTQVAKYPVAITTTGQNSQHVYYSGYPGKIDGWE